MEFICSGITSIRYPRWFLMFYKCTLGIRYLYLFVHILDTPAVESPVNVPRRLVRGGCIAPLIVGSALYVLLCPLKQRYRLH